MNQDPRTSSNQKLDSLLQGWAESQAPTADDLDVLHKRVQNALLASQPNSNSNESTAGRAVSKRLSRMSLGLLGALAASLLLVAIVWNWTRPAQPVVASSDSGKSSGGTSETEPSELLPPVLPDFTQQIHLIQKLQAAYQQPLNWFAETRDDIQVGLDDERSEADGQPWLLIRISMSLPPESLAQADHDGPPVWQMDLAIRNEQVVQLASDTSGTQQLVVWPYLTEDGLVMIDTKFNLSVPLESDHASVTQRRATAHVQGNESLLVRPGLRTRLATVRGERGEYDLWQYVQVVDPVRMPNS